uniref:Uncharacterized protein n=1 Tax=Octactis speculum TaxID=3111310 RepID=A0A7S2ME22_9STRA
MLFAGGGKAALPPLPENIRSSIADLVFVGTVNHINSSLVDGDGKILQSFPGEGSLELSSQSRESTAYLVVDACLDVEDLEKKSRPGADLDLASTFTVAYRHIILPKFMVGATGQHRGMQVGQRVRVFASNDEGRYSVSAASFSLVEPNGFDVLEQDILKEEDNTKIPKLEHSRRFGLGGTYELTRTLMKEECPWLDEDLPQGTTVQIFRGATYGVVGPEGVAVTLGSSAEDTPFFEIPRDSIQ